MFAYNFSIFSLQSVENYVKFAEIIELRFNSRLVIIKVLSGTLVTLK